jgi:hypothetical protein
MTGSPALATAITPQGLLVELFSGTSSGQPPEGSWRRLILAQSPDDAGSSPSYLAFEGDASTSVVSPVLATALMQNQGFLVVSDAAALGNFGNVIAVGGFRFRFEVGQGSPGVTGTILVFKFNTQYTLQELVAQPGLWVNVETFVGGPDQVADVQTALNDAIQVGVANAGASGNPFGVFNDLVGDRDWTGVLAFNLPIDGNGMPPDLQMLLGGINGQLTAHHFGIQGNRVSWTNGTPCLDSSLFGVIFYPGGTPGSPASNGGGDLDYEVESLTVFINNSEIVLFNVTVALTANALFGRDVTLLAASPASPMGGTSNTLSIAGTYQTSGGTGAVVFSTATPFTYQVNPLPNAVRVLERVEFDRASLVPFSSAPSATSRTVDVVARFTLGGQMWFAADPFPGSGGVDLFSFGVGQNGLAFSQFTVDVAFTLDPTGAMQPGSKTVTFRPELLVASATAQAIREGSLLFSLPLKLTNFVYAKGGLTPLATGAATVHCQQLQTASDGSSPATPRTAPYVTTAPIYALQFDLPLGTLGTLGDAHVGIPASLLLGWGPSQVVPGSDAAAVMIQLPALSVGYQGFNLEGLLKTTFGDVNLMKVDLGPSPADSVYVLLFNNVQLSIFGYTFPPGVMIDFVVFAGPPSGVATNTSNVAWFVAAQEARSS